MIMGRFKLIFFYHARRWELYDLASDIHERHNLAARRPGKLVQMNNLMFGPHGLGRFDPLFPETAQGAWNMEDVKVTRPAIEPTPGTGTDAAAAGWTAGGSWLDQHRGINAIARQGNVEIAFLGDSLTQSWGGDGRQVAATAPDIWQKYFGRRRAANFGISGDQTRNVLWRIEHGNFDGIDPALIVINIGTNDLGFGTAGEIARGIEQVVLRLEERRGRARILLLGVFPRGRDPDLAVRAKIVDINERIRNIADDKKTYFVDIGQHFLDEDGFALASHFQTDFVHLTRRGYGAWAEAIEPVVQRLLDKTSP